MNVLKWILNKTLLNWERPYYSKNLFQFCARYLDLWYGDNNFNRHTNGEFWVLQRLMPSAKLVIDVGANVGEYSQEILRLHPGIAIHAFEPDPNCHKQLSVLSLQANNFALGAKEETRALHRGARSAHNSFYALGDATTEISVNVSTLDAYCEKQGISQIDFLKIDVEGHEFAVLQGAESLLVRQAIKYIQFEFSGATVLARVFLKDFLDLFTRHGYDLYRIRAQDVQLVHYRPDCERFTLTNYLAIKKGQPVPGAAIS